MRRGKFITLEGADGSGKSTQAALLAEGLENSGLDVTLTREPGGAPGAEQIRSLLVEGETQRWSPLSEALLHYAARREHMDKTILPALETGKWVISDRFADSTMAYQGFGHQLGRNQVARIHDVVVGGFAPDLTIIFDISVEEGLKRAASRTGNEDRYERMDKDFHARLCKGFLEIARQNPDRCAVIDALGEIAGIQILILDLVKKRFELELS